jgi:hypothetical protein
MNRFSLFGAAGLLAACATTMAGTTVPLAASQDIPAAVGTVDHGVTDNNNTRLRIDVKHLAPPGRVSPGATTYVVWAEPDFAGGRPLNLGALQVDESLQGSMEATTALQSFTVFVTAEPSATAMEPKGARLLSARVERRR